MSFNKRYINIEMLKEAYADNGIEAVKRIFAKADALFINDETSSKIFKFISDGFDEKAIKLLKKNTSANK